MSVVDPLDSVSADTRRDQVRVFDQPEKCLELSRVLIAAKIRNQRTILMRNASDLPKCARETLAEQASAAEKADSLTMSAFNRAELRPGHFQKTAAGCLSTDHGGKAFFAAYGRRMNDEVTHPTFGYKLSYRRMLILHARMIAAWLNGEIATLSFLTTR